MGGVAFGLNARAPWNMYFIQAFPGQPDFLHCMCAMETKINKLDIVSIRRQTVEPCRV